MSGREVTLAALQAARRGWLVYPLRPRTKRPYFGRVADLATTDSDTILLWFDGVYRDADLGAIPPGHIVRIDVDRHVAGRDGAVIVEMWRARGDVLPPTLTCATPRGGRHLYYRRCSGAALTSHPLCSDGSVELKVGSVILPPSHGYRWLGYGEDATADLPGWVIERWRGERYRRWREHGRVPAVADAADLLDRIVRLTGEAPRMRGLFGAFRCPAHDDRRASAWVRMSDPIIVGCSAGCSSAAILAALGVEGVSR
jgi:hypothetical protein